MDRRDTRYEGHGATHQEVKNTECGAMYFSPQPSEFTILEPFGERNGVKELSFFRLFIKKALIVWLLGK